jgi:hypothetical protein
MSGLGEESVPLSECLAGFLNIPSDSGTSRCLCSIQKRLGPITLSHFGSIEGFRQPSQLFGPRKMGKNVIDVPDADMDHIFQAAHAANQHSQDRRSCALSES